MFIKVNFNQIIKDRLFYPLRNTFNLDWHKFLNSPIQALYETVLNIRKKNLFLTNHTSQKLSLEHLFNNLTDDLGNKIITGSPVYCETTGNLPLFYIFVDDEIVPNNVTAYYNYRNQVVQYNPLIPIAFTDTEIYDGSNNILLDNEELTWMFSDNESLTGGFTIFVDSVDFVGLIGYDSNNEPIYASGSKLDIINKYAKQYTVLGINYKIQMQ